MVAPRFQRYIPRVLGLLLLFFALPLLTHARTQNTPIQYPCTTRTGLYCEIYGKGDPILFLHGLGGSSYSWRYMVPKLATHNRVILIDFLGEGKSPKPKNRNYSILHEGDLIYDFIVEHNLRKLTLVGNSYGGGVALLLAIRLCAQIDNRLARLVLIDAGAYPKPLPIHLIVLRTPILGTLVVYSLPAKLMICIVLRESYYDPDKITEKQIDNYAEPLDEPGGRNALLWMGRKAIPRDIQDYIDEYPTISVPTLILWGTDDRILPTFFAEKLNKAIPKSYVRWIHFAGHIPQEEEPDAVACQIKLFLGQHVICPPQRPRRIPY